MNNYIKSRLNSCLLNFIIWLIFIIILARSTIPSEFIPFKITWLIISLGFIGMWGYLWDKESEKKYKELTEAASQ
jgi:hypothetical protein